MASGLEIFLVVFILILVIMICLTIYFVWRNDQKKRDGPSTPITPPSGGGGGGGGSGGGGSGGGGGGGNNTLPTTCWIPFLTSPQVPWQWASRPIDNINPPCVPFITPGAPLPVPVFPGYYDSTLNRWIGQFIDPSNLCGKNGLTCDATTFPPP